MNHEKIDAQITITASYEDRITITIHDKTSSTAFLIMDLTREQFINATMNRLAHTPIEHASVANLERVGKKLVMGTIVVKVSKYGDVKEATEQVIKNCPEGWTPTLSFTSQESFFKDDDGYHARTIIRRWE